MDFQKVIDDVEVPTKRVIASAIMEIFDVLGLVGPRILSAKLTLQEAWQNKLSWDCPLLEGLQIRWRRSLRTTPTAGVEVYALHQPLV